ncbi:MAG: response regulator [Chloroflexota bacterium]|nr:response regulator [Chloroflexota bacterium]
MRQPFDWRCASPSASPPRSTADRRLEGRRFVVQSCVLVVDDDQTVLDAVSLALSGEGYVPHIAHSGKEGLQRLAVCKPALILLDMHMPVMDGWEFARQYYRQAGRRAPIVVLTAAANPAQRAAEVGAEGYLAKPFDLEDLLDVVAKYVREGGNQSELQPRGKRRTNN